MTDCLTDGVFSRDRGLNVPNDSIALCPVKRVCSRVMVHLNYPPQLTTFVVLPV